MLLGAPERPSRVPQDGRGNQLHQGCVIGSE